MEQVTRFFIAILSAFIGYIFPSLSFILVALCFIIIDNISAYFCNLRVRAKFPTKCRNAKFSSIRAWKTLRTMGFAIGIIVLAFLLETQILYHFTDFKLTAMVSLMICGVTALSILENWASANDNAPKWLNLLRKFLIDKSERYFDADINGDGKIGKTEEKEDLNNKTDG